MTNGIHIADQIGIARDRTPTTQACFGGLVAGLGLFVATNLLAFMGGENFRPHFALLGQALVGYRVSFGGSLMGFVYGFMFGFCATYCVAVLYTGLANLKKRRRARG